MRITQDQVNDLYDAHVVTQDGDDLGGVGSVYLDDETGEPSWISVKTGWFGTNESLVPLADAEFSGDRIQIPYSQDIVKDAPNVDAERHLSEEEQGELDRYYGGVEAHHAGQDGDGRGRLRRHVSGDRHPVAGEVRDEDMLRDGDQPRR